MSELFHVLFRADGSHAAGLGHLHRVERIGRALAAKGARSTLLTVDTRESRTFASRGRLSAHWIEAGEREDEALVEALEELRPQVIVFDWWSTSAEVGAILQDFPVAKVSLDDRGPSAGVFDILIYSLVEVTGADEARARAQIVLEGPEYAVVNPRVQDLRPRRAEACWRAERAVVALGGSDPLGMSQKVAQAVSMADLRPTVLLGPAASWQDPALLNGPGEVLHDAPDFLDRLRDADLAVVSGALTLHEAAALGVPVAFVSQEEDHQPALAARFARLGVALDLGRAHEFCVQQVARSLSDLAFDRETRLGMSAAGLALVDGRGAERVADVIIALAQRKSV